MGSMDVQRAPVKLMTGAYDGALAMMVTVGPSRPRRRYASAQSTRQRRSLESDHQGRSLQSERAESVRHRGGAGLVRAGGVSRRAAVQLQRDQKGRGTRGAHP